VLSLAALVVALLVADFLLRVTGIDHRLLVSCLFFQGADPAVHRSSSDLFLHYELKPSSQYAGVFPGKPPYSVSIDENGARFPTHSKAKPPGTFRILGFGGSTFYGGAVNDDETIAAAMERRLNHQSSVAERRGRRFEVWNFGTSAYTLGQATHLARQKLPMLNPDLIVVQDHNRGRRGYFVDEDSSPESYPLAFFAADPHFYAEQFDTPGFLSPTLHRAAMAYSAAYRSIVAFVPSLCRSNSPYGEQLSAVEARALSEESAAQGVPVIYFGIPADRGIRGPSTIFPELPASQYVDLYRPGRDDAFYEVHPPAAILDQYAALLIEELDRRNLLPH